MANALGRGLRNLSRICGPSFRLRSPRPRSPGVHGPGLMRAGPSGEERCTPHYMVPVSPQCPQEISLPTQGAAVSSDRFSQLFPPGNVAELRGSPPLRGSLEQLVRPSPAGPPLQGTELAARETGSLSRLFGSVETMLETNVSQWVLRAVEKGYRIQFGTPPPPFNGVIPTMVSPSRLWSWNRK